MDTAVNHLHHRATLLLQQIAMAMQAQSSQGVDMSGFIAGYQRKLQEVYSEELPLAILRDASAACARIYQDACRRHQSACKDPQLYPDDGVADAYSAFIEALGQLHDTIEALREWIATHDAVLQPTTGAVYSSADDLFAALLPKQ